MASSLLLDTGGLLAALLPSDRHHQQAAEVLRGWAGPLVLSPFVLAELDYLLTKFGGSRAAGLLLAEVAAGAYSLASFNSAEVGEALAVSEQHRDLDLGLADASLVVLSRRYRSLDVLTLDERHFRSVRGVRGEPFRILPADARGA